jgi:hypothetical protein
LSGFSLAMTRGWFRYRGIEQDAGKIELINTTWLLCKPHSHIDCILLPDRAVVPLQS